MAKRSKYTTSSDYSVSGGRIGFCGVLTLIFITLKLTGNIDWSWWWVLSPIWIPIALVGVIFLIVVFAVCIGILFDGED